MSERRALIDILQFIQGEIEEMREKELDLLKELGKEDRYCKEEYEKKLKLFVDQYGPYNGEQQ